MLYVDELFQAQPRTAQAQRYGKRWCHLFSDLGNADELHQMAVHLGLSRSYFQLGSYSHYDLTPGKRQLAIQYGACAVSWQEAVGIRQRHVTQKKAGMIERRIYALGYSNYGYLVEPLMNNPAMLVIDARLRAYS